MKREGKKRSIILVEKKIHPSIIIKDTLFSLLLAHQEILYKMSLYSILFFCSSPAIQPFSFLFNKKKLFVPLFLVSFWKLFSFLFFFYPCLPLFLYHLATHSLTHSAQYVYPQILLTSFVLEKKKEFKNIKY